MCEHDPVLALDNQVCFALYAVNRAVTARYRPLLAELSLTYPQYLVMLVLWEHGNLQPPVRVSDLGSRLRLDSGTLTPLLKRLEDHGLLSRQRESEDERVVRIGLTNAGWQLRNKARAVPGRLVCELGLEEERLLSLRRELRELLVVLDQAKSSA